jgi:hypothetical protein
MVEDSVRLDALARAAICARILASPFTGAEELAAFHDPVSSMIVPPSRPFSFLNNALDRSR